MKLRKYRIKGFVMKSGERYCLLVDKASGVPLFYPNLFLATHVRNTSMSVSAMESCLAGINVLLTFCDEREFDLEARFCKRDFFELHELDSIRDYCQLDFVKSPANPPRAGILARRGNGRSSPNTIGLASVYMRLTHIAKYTRWLAEILLAPSLDRQTTADLIRMQKALESRRPTKKRRNQIGRVTGLSRVQLDVLLQIIQPGSDKNPFDDSSIQYRNQLMISMLLHLGIRGGELLNIRISDIDWSSNQIVIARRADEKADPRLDQPLVKTLDRRLPMKDTLVQQIHRYVIGFRNKIPSARKHDYLLVTHKSGRTLGQPMSRSAYMKVINLIAAAAPELRDLHGHQLRHSWNDAFSILMDAMVNPPSPDQQEKQRSYLQGWKENSGTSATYNRRFNEAKALEVSLKLQDGLSRIPESLKDV